MFVGKEIDLLLHLLEQRAASGLVNSECLRFITCADGREQLGCSEQIALVFREHAHHQFLVFFWVSNLLRGCRQEILDQRSGCHLILAPDIETGLKVVLALERSLSTKMRVCLRIHIVDGYGFPDGGREHQCNHRRPDGKPHKDKQNADQAKGGETADQVHLFHHELTSPCNRARVQATLYSQSIKSSTRTERSFESRPKCRIMRERRRESSLSHTQ